MRPSGMAPATPISGLEILAHLEHAVAAETTREWPRHRNSIGAAVVFNRDDMLDPKPRKTNSTHSRGSSYDSGELSKAGDAGQCL